MRQQVVAVNAPHPPTYSPAFQAAMETMMFQMAASLQQMAAFIEFMASATTSVTGLREDMNTDRLKSTIKKKVNPRQKLTVDTPEKEPPHPKCSFNN